MPAYCEVALPVPLDHTFTYGVRLGQRPQRGARVIAPFRNEKLIGVVTALGVKPPADVEVKYLEAVLDEEPLLSDHLLELAEWIAQYYLAPLGEVLRAMLPLAAEVRRTVYYRLTDLGRDVLARSMDGDQGKGIAPQVRRRGRLSHEGQDMERRVLERLSSGEPVKVSTLRTATAASLPLLAAMARKKWIARETAAAERDARRMERFAVLTGDGRLPALTEKQTTILAELAASGGELPLAELRRRDLPSSTLQTLVRRGLVRIDERPEAFRLGGLTPSSEPIYLNLAQIDALATITGAIGGARPRHDFDPARSRNWAHAADGRSARPGIRAEGGAAALGAHARGAQRAVAPHPSRRRAHRRRHAFGNLRARAESRIDPRRRGARPELQAGGNAALQRSRCCRDARQTCRRRRGHGLGHALA
jgi:primosomal protein N' (replication factor Y)